MIMKILLLLPTYSLITFMTVAALISKQPMAVVK